jgi:hypothetical protein
MSRLCASASCARRFRGDGPSTLLFSRSRIAGFDRSFSVCDLCLIFLVMCADDVVPSWKRVAGPFTKPNENGATDRRPTKQTGTDRNFRIRMPAIAYGFTSRIALRTRASCS